MAHPHPEASSNANNEEQYGAFLKAPKAQLMCICSLFYSCLEQVTRHMAKQSHQAYWHKGALEPAFFGEESVQCHYCKEILQSEDELDEHVRKKHSKCSECGLIF